MLSCSTVLDLTSAIRIRCGTERMSNPLYWRPVGNAGLVERKNLPSSGTNCRSEVMFRNRESHHITGFFAMARRLLTSIKVTFKACLFGALPCCLPLALPRPHSTPSSR